MKLRQNKSCRKISTQFRPKSEENKYHLRDISKCFEHYTDEIPTTLLNHYDSDGIPTNLLTFKYFRRFAIFPSEFCRLCR